MQFLQSIISGLLTFIVSVLPKDPFIGVISSIDKSISPYIGFLNWFVDFNFILKTLGIWLASIAVFYIWMTLGRWVKIIGD